ncbi:sensor histidine kinase KdpD [Cellulomonas sp. KRMCY2]|uniref:sensor histidine kinase n=1 Tax=Cellulomonas sp. KRMCY2 TaxID=1304865 RepID=UPI00045E7987|nr:sensor histidine kinase KdpD [Cellulomonas sp. KRMCY2]
MDPDGHRRGTLRVFLGAAPGVGKTFAMLDEAHRRRERGVDVVVGLVETHGRAATAQMLAGLEVVPRREVHYRDGTFTELDVDAVVVRRPAVAVIDELAHTNVPGVRNAKRWQDVEEILAAGIDVVTTVNIQHLESLNDVVESITGIRQQETLPDEVVRRADQIELVDMSPEALRRRLAHGNVYAPEKIDAALNNYFRAGNLTALRELALLWTADRVDDALEKYRHEHDIAELWPARERVVVAVTGGAEAETLIRRGARIAKRPKGGELLVLHVARGDGLAGAAPDALARHRAFTESLGGSWHVVVGDDIATAILDFARGVNANQVVLGATRRTRLAAIVSPGIAPDVVRGSGDMDVLIVTHERAGRGRRSFQRRGSLDARRVTAAWVLAVAGPPLLTLVLRQAADLDALPTVLMLFLTLTIGVALIGGLLPALVAAVAGGLLSNFWFTPPIRTWTVTEPQNALAIAILVAVAVAVSAVVDLSARRAVQATRARAEADILTTLAGSVLRGGDAVPAMLDQLREAFSLAGVALLRRDETARAWVAVGRAGTDVPTDPEHASTAVPVQDDLVLALQGRTLSAEDLRVVSAVGLQAEALLERDRLRAEARSARAERERTATRTALLAAVSHDLRTPLAGIKAGVTALTSSGPEIAADDERALLSDVAQCTDRLQALIDNLLDMSRLDAGAISLVRQPVTLDEIVPRAVDGLPTSTVVVDVPETLPQVMADAGLLERAIANVVENALRYTPAAEKVHIVGEQLRDTVVLRIIDRGPGVPDNRKNDIFTAFQRLGDVPSGHGVGLGLAVARGFVEANGGTIEAEDTPGGGLTMVITLPAAGGTP